MTPNTVVCADALEWLRSLPDASVDVWWSSPHYNLRDRFRGNGTQHHRIEDGAFAYAPGAGKTRTSGDGNYMPEDEYQEQQLAVLREWHRTLAPEGYAFYNHKVRSKFGRAVHPMSWIGPSPLVLMQEVVWDRQGTVNVDTRRFLPVSERIYVLTKRSSVWLHNPLRWPDVWALPPTHHERAQSGHPCPTHPEVVRRCLATVPKPAGRRLLVADCYAGTGTTGLVARSLGMDYLLCDHAPAYIDLIERNLGRPMQPALIA